MIKHALAALGFVVAASTAQAQTVGIASCDDFLTKYDACVPKLPEAHRATMKQQLDQMRSSWIEASKSPQAKVHLESMCTQTAEQMKAAVKDFGCSF